MEAGSGAAGLTRPHGLVGAKDILGLGGSGLAGATGAGAGTGTTGLTLGSPSWTNQQSLPKLQWPLR